MKRRQEIALADPCAYADETLDAAFYERVRGYSSMLTVNK